jgi:phage replication O-like protein O
MAAAGGAKIQTENGFVKIHPKILDLLAAADLTSSEFRCVMFVLRKTYGWGKKEDAISYRQIAEATGLSRRGVINSMKALMEKRVLSASDPKLGRNGCRVYSFNKYFEEWDGVINGEVTFTIKDEMVKNVSPLNSEECFTINTEMVNGCSLEMVNGCAPTIDTIDILPNGSESPSDDGSANAERELSLSEQFQSLNSELRTTKNQPAVLRKIYTLCFGESSAPNYGYLGKVSKHVGSPGRLAQLMFELVPRPPAGDVLAYIVAQEDARKRRAKQTGGNRAPENVTFNNGSDIYA